MTMRDRIVTSLLLFVTLSIGIAGCGGKQESSQAEAPEPSAPPAAADAAKAAEADPGPDALRPANAVTTGKAGAAVDLQYEVTPRPEAGQPFAVELAFVPRLPADSIDAQLSATSGLRITSPETVHFEGLQAGERYTTQVIVMGDAPGLYYVGVVARMSTKVQTDARTFSVPVVVGTPAVAEKPQAEVDAGGTPIESMPAVESGGN